jgi:phage gpG-like protein
VVIRVTVDDRAVVERLQAMPRKVEDALKKTYYRLAVDLQKYIIRQKLSASPGYSATMLHRVSGDLVRSIQWLVTSSTQEVTGKVYSAGDVKYAALHEYGGSFTKFGRLAGDYTVRMPQRSFMRTSLRENEVNIVDQTKMAVAEGLKE